MIGLLLICALTATAALDGSDFEFVSTVKTAGHDLGPPVTLGHNGVDDVQETSSHGRKARSALIGKERKWPNGVIPYTYTTDYEPHLKAKITTAMKEIEENTCITFVPRSNETDFITFGAHPNGRRCSSDAVGRIGKGKQIIYLSNSNQGSCLYHGIIQHELLHAVGLEHEHNRADRDEYLNINMTNVAPHLTQQFRKADPTDFFDFGCSYNYESVMHYDKTSFGVTATSVTMEVRDAKFADVIGKMKKAHPNDLEIVNRVYGCQKPVPGHTCGVKPETPCEDEPTKPCKQIKGLCHNYPGLSQWCRKTCDTCN